MLIKLKKNEKNYIFTERTELKCKKLIYKNYQHYIDNCSKKKV